MNKQTAATIEVRRAEERGRTNWGWLDSRHTFSFGDYFDEDHMGFGALRVINDDRVDGGGGFGTHGHRDMEILSYVLDGAMEHKDNMGTGSVIHPGEIQLMRAGSGVTHSEFNRSKTEPLHFLQIWIVPDARGLKPAYAQHAVDQAAARDSFALLASKDGRDGSIPIHQDVNLWLALIAPQQSRTLALRPGRRAWIHVARGSAILNGVELKEGDGAGIINEEAIELTGKKVAEVLIFDLD
jgi:quercetin 2,3-dioxygenase